MPATVLTLALRTDELVSNTGSTEYSLVLGAGWVSLILGLTAMGRLGDQIQAKTNSRRAMVLAGLVGSLTFGLLASQAHSVITLAIAWCALQFPAAAIISSSLALAADYVPEHRRGVASGVAGGAPVFALFVGTLATQLFAPSAAGAFFFTSLIAVALAAPLLALRGPKTGIDTVSPADVAQSEMTFDTTSLWTRFLISAFLLSCATSSANGYLLVFATDALHLSTENASALVTNMVLVATLSSIIAGVISGHFARTPIKAIWTYGFAAFTVGSAVGGLALHPTTATAMFVALVFGTGFGTANGLELSIYLHNYQRQESAGKTLGIFTAVTTLPYVVIPLIASFILRSGQSSDVITVWLLGAVAAVLSGLLILQSRKGL